MVLCVDLFYGKTRQKVLNIEVLLITKLTYPSAACQKQASLPCGRIVHPVYSA
jgi:hypothetical protein